MRKYYYERDDHDEFMKHCSEDCDNVECYCVDYDDPDTGVAAWYKTEWPTIDCVAHNIERHNKFPYRCYIDVSNETKGNE